jgi:hypothetical protein
MPINMDVIHSHPSDPVVSITDCNATLETLAVTSCDKTCFTLLTEAERDRGMRNANKVLLGGLT